MVPAPRVLLLLAANLALAPTAQAQAQQDACWLRTVPVSVLDEHVRPVVGLSVHDFAPSVSGQPAEVASVEPVQGPRRVIVMLDASAGMNHVDAQADLARALAADALRASTKAFRAGLVVFDSEVRASYPPAENPKRASAALRDVHPAKVGENQKNEHAALWDALQAALTLLNPPEFGDAIWVITNGEDASSQTTPGEIAALALARGVRVSILLFNPATSFPALPVISSGAIFDIPAHTGGLVVRVEAAQGTFRNREVSYRLTPSQFRELDAAVDVLYAATQYAIRVQITLPEELTKPAEWKLSIAAPKWLKVPWRVSYPALLNAHACAAPPAKSPP